MYYYFIQYSDLLFQITLCCILAGLVGFNREKNGMTVGIRTHILVGLCAVLLQTTTIDYAAKTGYTGDVFRLGGQMISGLGFLCGGAIIKGDKQIRGLTTATSLFFVACIGLAVGSGMYIPAVLITLVGYSFLIDLFKLKRSIQSNKSLSVAIAIETTGNYAESAKDITEALNSLDAEIESIDVIKMSMEKSKITLVVKIDDEVFSNDIIDSLMAVESITKSEIIKKY